MTTMQPKMCRRLLTETALALDIAGGGSSAAGTAAKVGTAATAAGGGRG